MVEFDGVQIESVAPVKLDDVFISAPSVELTTQSVPLMDGVRFVRSKRGTRTVTVPFAVMEDNEEIRRNHIKAVTEWATSKGLCTLRTSQEKNGYLLAVCSQLPDESSKKFWDIMTLAFVAVDPCYIENTEHSQNVTAAVNLTGKEAPMIRIEQTVSSVLTNPTWRCGETHITLSRVTAGRLIIDLYSQTITLNGESIMEQMTIDSDFFEMSKENNKIICTNGAGGVLYWRKRWV